MYVLDRGLTDPSVDFFSPSIKICTYLGQIFLEQHINTHQRIANNLKKLEQFYQD